MQIWLEGRLQQCADTMCRVTGHGGSPGAYCHLEFQMIDNRSFQAHFVSQ